MHNSKSRKAFSSSLSKFLIGNAALLSSVTVEYPTDGAFISLACHPHNYLPTQITITAHLTKTHHKTAKNSPQHQAIWWQHSYVRSSSIQSIQSFPLYILPGTFFFTLSFSYDFIHPFYGRPAFHFAFDGWPKRTLFGSLSSFIHRSLLSHVNLFLSIALESGIKPYFSYSRPSENGQSVGYPKQSLKRFLWKTLSKSSPNFGVPMLQNHI